MKEKLESLALTRISACFTISSLAGSDTGAVIVALAELEEMLDKFYAEHKDLVSKEEYELAKESPEAFVALIDRTHRNYLRLAREGGESS
ncbi:MAG TPA: hypothetical protein PK175_06295 [Syntrophales bacterium]|jgi:hypothetical protein|nr:hypothetical protein [Syntrophales bacterium]HON23784.1 hypothetical protein [Syntrophales bacterium]HOU77865.1 hypothetical protein [Syntrophales bacterium]HPC31754.1 hypothetical protein [Syntrophales bacterium]HQG34461.1 hypothetical protein [Syntrophales bacterium]